MPAILRIVPVIFGTSVMDTSHACVRDLRIVQQNHLDCIIMRLEHLPTDTEEIVVLFHTSDQLERACLLAADEFLWRSPFHDEACERNGELEVVFYLHAHDTWDLTIMEDHSHEGALCTSVTLVAH